MLNWLWIHINAMRWQSKILVCLLLALIALNLKQYHKVADFNLIKFSELTRSEGIVFFEIRGKHKITGVKLNTGELIYFGCSLPIGITNVSCLPDRSHEQKYGGKHASVWWTDSYQQKFPDSKYLMQMMIAGDVVDRHSYEWDIKIVDSYKNRNMRDNFLINILYLGLIFMTLIIEGIKHDDKRNNTSDN